MYRSLALLAACTLTALLWAAPAGAAPPSVTPATATEGDALSVTVTHKCGKKAKCAYSVTTADDTAIATADYTATTQTGKAKKGKRFTATVTVPTVEDTLCEATETFKLRVTLTVRGATVNTGEGILTVNDDDCTEPLAPAGSGQPAPPNALPAKPAEATVTTKRTEKGLSQTCTLQAFGTPQGPTFALPSCSVYVWCPTSAKACSADGNTLVVGGQNGPMPETVTGNAKSSRNAKPPVALNEVPCGGPNTCTAAVPTIALKPGEFAQLDCSGTHMAPAQQQPAPGVLQCKLEIAYTL